jgi:hypothetical protein
MKSTCSFTRFLSLLILFGFFVTTGISQNITFNLITQPCNADGVLEITAAGANLPCSMNIYRTSSGFLEVSLTNSTTYTLNNYTGELIYVSVYGQQSQYYGEFSAPAVEYTFTKTDAICPILQGTLSATITTTQAPYSIYWYDSNTNLIAASGSPASVPPGIYRLEIIDANGCVSVSSRNADSSGYYHSDSIYVNSVSNITGVTSTTPAGCTDGTASISGISGGLAPYTYLWSNGANTSTISGLSSGYFSLRVSDAQGCFKDFYIYVSQSISIATNVVMTPATCLQSDGALMAFASNGTPPYSFLWDDGQTVQNHLNLPGGYYQFTATDANGCSGTGGGYIQTTTPITVTFSATPSSCTAPTGSAILTISGGLAPYSVIWNTFPTQTGNSILNYRAGSYGFTITDQNGCRRAGSAVIPPVSTISGAISTAPSLCTSSVGTATAVFSGSAPPLTYVWSTSATTPQISGLAAGSYQCTATDVNGCTKTVSGYVATTSPINIGFNVTPVSCIYNTDGGYTAIASGGTPPYTWAGGSSTVTNLGPGYYYAQVTDANGCTAQRGTAIPNSNQTTSCYCTISGYAYNDLNGNCTQDSGEDGIANVMIGCSSYGYKYTDADGYYEFRVQSGTYQVSENPQGLVNLGACQNNNQTVTASAAQGCVLTVNFGNTLDEVHDVKILTVGWNRPVPGNVYQQRTIVSNEGTYSESGIQLGFAHDGQLGYSSSAPLAYAQEDALNFPDWYGITTGFPVLNYGSSILNYNEFNTPTNIPLGTQIVLKDTVSYIAPMANWLNENSPWNNVEYYTTEVVGSFDPNFKEVRPSGKGPFGLISRNDSLLTYLIHFQNTGTAPAQLVVLSDTLDQNLNFRTLRPGWSSHDYVASLSEDGVLSFRFDHINLPDSASNPMGSMGVVEYTIRLKPNLEYGTRIRNTAAIYFDYNAPVITNTTINTLDEKTGILEVNRANSQLTCYPNPASEQVNISFSGISSKESATVKIMDMSGKLVYTKSINVTTGNNNLQLELASLNNGIYFIQLETADSRQIGKLSIVR